MNLGDSQRCAQKRFRALERKLSKQPDLRWQYDAFIEEYEALGHMTLVNNSDNTTNDSIRYYFSHHAVTKDSSTTTKLRVVLTDRQE